MELLSRMQRSGRLPRCIVTGAVFAALWYFLLECLGQYWVVQPEYSFGWLVPILCGLSILASLAKPACTRRAESRSGSSSVCGDSFRVAADLADSAG